MLIERPGPVEVDSCAGMHSTHSHQSGGLLRGMIGRITWEGRAVSMYTLFCASIVRVCLPMGSPVFGFTSNLGKLLLAMSSLIRWPAWNRLLVGGKGILTR